MEDGELESRAYRLGSWLEDGMECTFQEGGTYIRRVSSLCRMRRIVWTLGISWPVSKPTHHRLYFTVQQGRFHIHHTISSSHASRSRMSICNSDTAVCQVGVRQGDIPTQAAAMLRHSNHKRTLKKMSTSCSTITAAGGTLRLKQSGPGNSPSTCRVCHASPLCRDD